MFTYTIYNHTFDKSKLCFEWKNIYIYIKRFIRSSSSIQYSNARRRYRLVRREKMSCRWNELIRETFVQRSNSNRFPDREEFSKGGITTCIHIWNSGLYPRGSLCRFSSGISRDLRPGGGEGCASGLHRYGLRVIPCKPRQAFFLRFSAPAFIPLEKRERSLLVGNHQSVSFLSRRVTWSGKQQIETTIFTRRSDLVTLTWSTWLAGPIVSRITPRIFRIFRRIFQYRFIRWRGKEEWGSLLFYGFREQI